VELYLCPNILLLGVNKDNFFFPVFEIKGRENVGIVLPNLRFLTLLDDDSEGLCPEYSLLASFILDFKLSPCSKCCMLMARLISSQTLSHIIPPTFLNLIHSSRNHLPMKIEKTECSETSAHKIQTPGNNPEESIQVLS